MDRDKTTQTSLRRRAFTLVELIVVIVVLGILASIAIVGYKTVVDKSVESKQTLRMTQILKEAKVLYTQKTYSDPLYTWDQAVADAVDDLPVYSLNSWSEGVAAAVLSNLNAGTNGWTVRTDSGSGVFSAAPNDIVVSTSPSGVVYVASALSSTRGVFGMISATTAPRVWGASCLGSSCDAESATVGPPAGGAYSAGTTTAPTTSVAVTTTTAAPTTTIATPTTTAAPTTTLAPTTTALPTPGAPTISTVTAAHLSLSVSFSAPAPVGGSVSNYQYSTDNGSTWVTRTPAATTSPVSITGLTNGVTYQVKLRAVNNGGSGTASNVVAGTPQWSAMTASCSGCTSSTVVSGGRTYLQYVFTGGGSMTITSAGSDAAVDYLVVGGGGGGATNGGNGGAGGSGGQTRHGSLSVSAGSYAASVGGGGASTNAWNVAGVTGGSSAFGSVTATGGCSGAAWACGMYYDTTYNGSSTYRGGGSWVFYGGGGGAGAGGDGASAPGNETGGNGGSALSIWGASYSGGGGGGGGSNGLTAAGGSGAGSGRGYLAGGNGASGVANTGGGGGGGYSSGGNGGSGIVIVRYAITAP